MAQDFEELTVPVPDIMGCVGDRVGDGLMLIGVGLSLHLAR
jgi:hypothetical protein